MTSAETYTLLDEFPECPVWVIANRDSITYDEARSMMKARRACLRPRKPLKVAS